MFGCRVVTLQKERFLETSFGIRALIVTESAGITDLTILQSSLEQLNFLLRVSQLLRNEFLRIHFEIDSPVLTLFTLLHFREWIAPSHISLQPLFLG